MRRTSTLLLALVTSLAGTACSSVQSDTAPIHALDDGGGEDATIHGADGSSSEATLPDGEMADVSDARLDANLSADSQEAAVEVTDGAPDASPDAAPDAAPDAPPDAADAQPDSGPLPTNFAPTHLRLWLTADKGLSCAPVAPTVRRVTYWADQSGHGDDAYLQRGQLGPQCAVAGGTHSTGGVDLPYFSAPQNGNIVDETLDVDLSFLASASFTVFVVERRWADYSPGTTTDQEIILGTSEPPSVEAANPQTCGSVTPNQIFSLGYTYGSSVPNITYDQWCGIGMGATASTVPSTPPGPLSLETVRLDSVNGHQLWVDGAQVASNGGTAGVVYGQGGAVGRGFVVTNVSGQDMRFRGDIAEIVAYDASLSDSQRTQVESYLRRHWSF